MAQPAEDDAVDDEEDGELLEVDGEITEVLDHGEACADERRVDYAVGDVVEFIAQYKEEQQQAETFDRLFSDTCIQSLKGRANDIAGIWPEQVGEHAIHPPFNKEGRWDGDNGSPQEGSDAQKPGLVLVAVNEVDEQEDAYRRYGGDDDSGQYAADAILGEGREGEQAIEDKGNGGADGEKEQADSSDEPARTNAHTLWQGKLHGDTDTEQAFLFALFPDLGDEFRGGLFGQGCRGQAWRCDRRGCLWGTLQTLWTLASTLCGDVVEARALIIRLHGVRDGS